MLRNLSDFRFALRNLGRNFMHFGCNSSYISASLFPAIFMRPWLRSPLIQIYPLPSDLIHIYACWRLFIRGRWVTWKTLLCRRYSDIPRLMIQRSVFLKIHSSVSPTREECIYGHTQWRHGCSNKNLMDIPALCVEVMYSHKQSCKRPLCTK